MIPKFRAWHKELNEFVRVDKHCVIDQHGQISCSDYVILLQSTGLHDKNGVEIFEGDIVECKQRNAKRYVAPLCERVGVVVFDKKLLSWVFGKYVFSPMMFEYKVIGNIYENPELLEQQNG